MVFKDKIAGSDGDRCNFGPISHDFHHLEQFKGKCGNVRDVLEGGGFWALIMAQGAPHMYFTVPWDRKKGICEKGCFQL